MIKIEEHLRARLSRRTFLTAWRKRRGGRCRHHGGGLRFQSRPHHNSNHAAFG